MRRLKTVAQVILILSIVNFVLAAPAAREIHEARDDVMVRVLAEDVEGVSEKRGNGQGGGLIYEYPDDEGYYSSDDEGYHTASDDEGYHTASEDDGSPPKPAPSKKTSTRPKIMTPEKIKAIKIIAPVGLLTVAVLGLVDLHISMQNTSTS